MFSGKCFKSNFAYCCQHLTFLSRLYKMSKVSVTVMVLCNLYNNSITQSIWCHIPYTLIRYFYNGKANCIFFSAPSHFNSLSVWEALQSYLSCLTTINIWNTHYNTQYSTALCLLALSLGFLIHSGFNHQPEDSQWDSSLYVPWWDNCFVFNISKKLRML